MLRSLDQFDFHRVLGETPGVSLVIFTAPGCGSCRHWKRLLQDYATGHGGLALFEVDAARDEALAREFEVFHLPALFVYRDGVYHCALQCEARADRLREALIRALQAPAEEAP